jgi:hypothetical protein
MEASGIKEREFCEIDGGIKQLENHHVVFRSRGGGDEQGNMMTLCRECHSNIHTGGWILEYVDVEPGSLIDLPEWLVIDTRAEDPDDQIVSRWFEPQDASPALLAAVAGRHAGVDGRTQLKAMASLRWDDLKPVDQMLQEHEVWSHIARAGFYYFCRQRRLVGDSYAEIGKFFGVGHTVIYRRSRMFERLFVEHPDRIETPPLLPISYLEAAAAAGDPESALEYALQHYGPGFSLRQFEADMGIRHEPPASETGMTVAFMSHEFRYVLCPCGCEKQFRVNLKDLKDQSADPYPGYEICEDLIEMA